MRRAAADLLTLTLDKPPHAGSRRCCRVPAFRRIWTDSDRGFARAIATAQPCASSAGSTRALAPLLSRPLPAASGAHPGAAAATGADTALADGRARPHAAVGETVEAAKGWPEARSGGAFLNAVLRRAADRERPDLDALPVAARDLAGLACQPLLEEPRTGPTKLPPPWPSRPAGTEPGPLPDRPRPTPPPSPKLSSGERHRQWLQAGASPYRRARSRTLAEYGSPATGGCRIRPP